MMLEQSNKARKASLEAHPRFLEQLSHAPETQTISLRERRVAPHTPLEGPPTVLPSHRMGKQPTSLRETRLSNKPAVRMFVVRVRVA